MRKYLKMGYMWRSLLSVILLVQSSYGLFEHCDMEECDALNPADMLEESGFLPPNEAELEKICQPFMRYMICLYEKVQYCVGKDTTDFIGIARNENMVEEFQIITTISDLIVDVCSNDSDFHKRYVASIDCFRGMVKERDDSCYLTALMVYRTYKGTLLAAGSEESNPMEQRCMVSGYTMACVVGKLNQRCGENAAKTLMEVIQRLNGVVPFNDCKGAEGEKLRGQFLDVVEATEGEGASPFREVFDILKKRK